MRGGGGKWGDASEVRLKVKVEEKEVEVGVWVKRRWKSGWGRYSKVAAGEGYNRKRH